MDISVNTISTYLIQGARGPYTYVNVSLTLKDYFADFTASMISTSDPIFIILRLLIYPVKIRNDFRKVLYDLLWSAKYCEKNSKGSLDSTKLCSEEILGKYTQTKIRRM